MRTEGCSPLHDGQLTFFPSRSSFCARSRRSFSPGPFGLPLRGTGIAKGKSGIHISCFLVLSYGLRGAPRNKCKLNRAIPLNSTETQDPLPVTSRAAVLSSTFGFPAFFTCASFPISVLEDLATQSARDERDGNIRFSPAISAIDTHVTAEIFPNGAGSRATNRLALVRDASQENIGRDTRSPVERCWSTVDFRQIYRARLPKVRLRKSTRHSIEVVVIWLSVKRRRRA